ncbi:MAG: hypothetical protein B7Z37_16175 [Verrucomicrobia bacterium 12-59-8]|nr:MAG: hypothetical protein B7Z37_16175 [Verrucomicrobia bacterium 12-59-8]
MDNQSTSNELWYYAEGEAVKGPFSLSELLKKADEGLLNAETLVVVAGSEEWRPFASVAPTHGNPLADKEASPQPAEPPPIQPKAEASGTTGSMEKADAPKLRDKFFAAPAASSEQPPPNNKEALKGCGALILLLVGAVVLWHHWRLLLCLAGFLGVWYGFASSNLASKRSKVYSIGGGLVLGLLTMILLRSCVGSGAIDLTNPPVALEKLARQALDGEHGIESIKVEPMGPDQTSYSIHIKYHARFLLSEESTLKSIRLTMERAYADVLKYPELPVMYFKIAAQLELQDSYGNEKGWSDVYRTQLSNETIQRLNRSNLDAVDFSKLWEVVYIHPMFWPFKDDK